MTPAQKKLIESLRVSGLACSVIAEQTGIPLNSVKSFCHRKGIKAPEKVTGKSFLEKCPMPEITFCEFCSSPMYQFPGRKKKRFCSDRCRMNWWSKNRTFIDQRTEHEFTCEACGKVFSVYGVKNRRFCSRACADSARRKAAKHDT